MRFFVGVKRALTALALVGGVAGCVCAQQTPSPQAAEWWRLTTALANDGMQGRDTGSEAYERAAHVVADEFRAYGLKPAGDGGTYFQRVPMHEVDLDTAHSSVELVAADGSYAPLVLLYETTLVPRAELAPSTEGQLVFVGYGGAPEGMDLRGKIAVFFNSVPKEMPASERARFATERVSMLAKSGVAGLVSIDNPAATEPTHWPAAYAHSVALSGVTGAGTRVTGAGAGAPLLLRISAEAASKLFAGTDTDARKILADAEKGLPLPVMELKRRLRVRLSFVQKDISSPNVIAVLPGSDAKLAGEYVALSAHLDGYGFGTAVNGDNLYNGALDDAAYVATLLEMAKQQSAKPPARSLLLCIFTGEEKGLLGSAYYMQHTTVPVGQIVANLNLDQLRPIFPLKILTMEGLGDSTLTETVKTVAGKYGIEIRPDREPERSLYRRADNFNFVKVGVPIAAFVFGYDPGTEEERIYRDWYARRYHKPQDDLTTPIDWDAAVKFNNFYRELAATVANAPARPQWNATSPNAPK